MTQGEFAPLPLGSICKTVWGGANLHLLPHLFLLDRRVSLSSDAYVHTPCGNYALTADRNMNGMPYWTVIIVLYCRVSYSHAVLGNSSNALFFSPYTNMLNFIVFKFKNKKNLCCFCTPSFFFLSMLNLAHETMNLDTNSIWTTVHGWIYFVFYEGENRLTNSKYPVLRPLTAMWNWVKKSLTLFLCCKNEQLLMTEQEWRFATLAR